MCESKIASLTKSPNGFAVRLEKHTSEHSTRHYQKRSTQDCTEFTYWEYATMNTHDTLRITTWITARYTGNWEHKHSQYMRCLIKCWRTMLKTFPFGGPAMDACGAPSGSFTPNLLLKPQFEVAYVPQMMKFLDFNKSGLMRRTSFWHSFM